MEQLYASLVFYPTLCWNLLLARVLSVRHWWDEVDDNVLIGAFPFKSDVTKLAQAGIQAVVNTCQEYSGPQSTYEQYGIEQLHVPTIDFTHPTLESIEAAVAFMEERIGLGQRVYVHCKAGRGRSATIVACWLIKHYQITADEAQAWLTRVRPHVNASINQRPVVRQFEQKYLKRSDRSSSPVTNPR